MSNQMQNKQMILWKLCKKFVEDNKISCAETVHQVDHIAENSPEFIEAICGNCRISLG